MCSKIPFPSMAPGVGWLRFWLPLLALLLCGSAFAQRYQDLDINGAAGGICPSPGPPPPPLPKKCPAGDGPNVRCFAAAVNQDVGLGTIGDEQTIGVVPGSACAGGTFNVAWTFKTPTPPPPPNGCTSIASNQFDCAGMTVTVPPPGPSTSTVITIKGTPTVLTDAWFTLGVTAECSSGSTQQCSGAPYHLHVTGTGGGWGDPHIITVDNVAYDFQSAGEFTALRGKGLEIQTRQTPVPTAPAVAAGDHTGLKSCVSIYTAVAARVGKHRVTYEPNISGVPDPSGLQLRVDGKLTKLGPEGIDLASEGPSDEDEDEDERARRGKYQPRQHSTAPAQGAIVKRPSAGRIVKSPAGDAIEIHYADGTTLVVTPKEWKEQKKWYLDVNVYETTATKGIMGLTTGGWLPALPNGKSLGPRPAPLHDRYVQLYKKFADAWRVTEDTSLFDYAKGTSTQTFTNRDWPREDPSSCAIEGEPTAQPIEVHVAEKYCSAVVDKNNKANCVFDVSVTGNPGFAEIYQSSERLQPGLTETTVKDDTDPTQIGDSVTFTATVLPALARGGGIPAGTVQFIVDDGKAGDPVTLDTFGRAAWSTSNLQAGEHHVVANYNPTGFGERFLASSSPKICHTVEGGSDSHPVK